jgi:predicted amidohydrolase
MLNKPKTLEVVTLQLPSHKRYQENLDTLLLYLKDHEDKHIVVAPEVYLTPYDYDHMPTAAKFSAKALKILKGEVNEQIVVITLILESQKKIESIEGYAKELYSKDIADLMQEMAVGFSKIVEHVEYEPDDYEIARKYLVS